MIGDQGNLTDYCPSLLHNYSTFVVGNGSHLPILGTGIASLHTPTVNFTLHVALHTPNLVTNLVYVRRFTKDNTCVVEFDP